MSGLVAGSISRTVVTVTYLNIEPSISNMSEYSHQ